MARSAEQMMAYALEMDPELLPHAAELLQDLDALGSDPSVIAGVLHGLEIDDHSFVVDLGCGKGAASIAVAVRCGSRVLGIDLHDGLIAEAQRAAALAGVGDRCEFVVGDVADVADLVEAADVAVFAALGDVLGPLDATIEIVRRYVRPGGLIVVSDVVMVDDAATPHEGFESTTNLDRSRALLTAHGDVLVREVHGTSGDDRDEAALVRARAADLARRHPELEPVLRRFVDGQRTEYEFLEAATADVVWALRRV